MLDRQRILFFIVEKASQPQIEDFNGSLFIEQQIAGLDIAMNHPTVIGVINRARELVQVACYLTQWHRPLLRGQSAR